MPNRSFNVNLISKVRFQAPYPIITAKPTYAVMNHRCLPWNQPRKTEYILKRKLRRALVKESASRWCPPALLDYYRLHGPKSIPRRNKTITLHFIGAIARIDIGGYCNLRNEGATIPVRILSAQPVDHDQRYYSVLGKIALTTDLAICAAHNKGYLPFYGGTLIQYSYCPQLGEGAIEKVLNQDLKNAIQYTVPIYHLSNRITCTNHDYQIGYQVTAGPTLERLKFLHTKLQQDKRNTQVFSYNFAKIIYCKSQDYAELLSQSITAEIEIIKVCYLPENPDYCMAIGIIRRHNPLPDFASSTPAAEKPTESDDSLFANGSYVHIDHYGNRRNPSDSDLPLGNFNNGTEYAHINYCIGPKTNDIGAFPFFPLNLQ